MAQEAIGKSVVSYTLPGESNARNGIDAMHVAIMRRADGLYFARYIYQQPDETGLLHTYRFESDTYKTVAEVQTDVRQQWQGE